jgi:hypothetical protein
MIANNKQWAIGALSRVLDFDLMPIAEAMLLIDDYRPCDAIYKAVGSGILDYAITTDEAMNRVMKVATVGDLKSMMADAGIDGLGYDIRYLCCVLIQARVWMKCLQVKVALGMRSART